MTVPAVSVIVPVFNSESTIIEAVRSALRQSEQSLEVLVVDDGSTDGTADRVAELRERDSRVRLLEGPHQGVAGARNRGLAVAAGKYVAFLDADDEWVPEKLEIQLNRLESEPEVVAIGCRMTYRDSRGRILGSLGQEFTQDEVRMAKTMPFATPSLVVRRSAVQAVGGFRAVLDRLGHGQAEDLDLLSRLADLGEVAFVDEPLGFVRLSRSSTTARHFREQRLATRYVRACADARRSCVPEPDFDTFVREYRLGWNQRRGDLAQSWYRKASRSAAERQYVAVFGYTALASCLAPRYVIRRTSRILGSSTRRSPK